MNAKEIYNHVCNFSPTPEQEEAFEVLTSWDATKNPLVLKLPCGYGKTESVVIPYLAQAFTDKWSLAPRLIYVLPTRALCNQIKERIEAYALAVKKLTSRELKVSVEHGMSSLDPLFFADICVTTFDQFLYGYARNKSHVGRHVDVPAGAFANSVVVFDEAHLYSPYTHALMKALLEFLSHSKIPVVVMTATMPKTLQDDLLEDLNPMTIEFKGKFLCDRELSWEMKEWRLLDGEKASKDLLASLSTAKNQKVLIVANRVDVAQKLAIELKDKGVKLIHSRFSANDRDDKEKAVTDLLGKESNSKKGIVISTQVCEVGLDISADVLITECASADALVQRIGRVARWGGSGKVLIVKPESVIKDDKEMFYPYVDKKLGDKGDFVKIVDEYLRQKPNLEFTSWEDTKDLCDQMEYRADYVEARNAMGQVFEATLYADSVPYNLSARNELYCTVFIGTIIKPKKGKSGESSKSISINSEAFNVTEKIPYGVIKLSCLNIPYLWFRRFWRKEEGSEKGLKIVEYDPETQILKENTWNKRPSPFKIYLLVDEEGVKDEDKNYTPEIGLRPKPREMEIIEEACLIC